MKKRLLSVVLALAMICGFAAWVPDLEAFAASYNGNIYNNGLGGIYIDISAYPYNSMINEYAYGPGGCAWFASCRAKQFSNKVNKIWGANNWINYGSSYGFTVDNTPSAGSIMCWTTGNDGNGHVAFLEKIEGNTAYISEGGYGPYPNNSYCRIYTVSVSSMTSKQDAYQKNMNFGGYVHVKTGTKPAWAYISLPRYQYNVGESIKFYFSSDIAKKFTLGIFDSNGNRVYVNTLVARAPAQMIQFF
jgi:surface antigen